MSMPRHKQALIIGATIAALAMNGSAQAATATTTFPVTATVLRACVVTANPLNFGNYDPTAPAALDTTTTLSVLCTIGTSFTVGLNAGTTSGSTVTTRRMANSVNSANLLNYALYQEAARTTNWGNTPNTDTPAATIAPLLASTLTVFGRVPSGQNVPEGAYSDTVTVTVNY